MKQVFHYFAPCPRGLETVLAQELAELGALGIAPTDGGVAFHGDWQLMYRANLHSRIASRILWRLVERSYRSEDDIYKAARSIEWPELFPVSCTIKVAVTGVGCKLRSLDFIALKVKDAVCDSFRAACDERPSVDTAKPDIRVHVFLTDRQQTIYIDTSGEALFKRGYRRETGGAPLRENLAAGILRLAGWKADEPLLDPMCGSGTFLVEAALIAKRMAPGRWRNFAFEHFKQFDAIVWNETKQLSFAAELPNATCAIYGSDDTPEVLAAARANLTAAEVGDAVVLEEADALERNAPSQPGVLVCNPPYGIRLEEQTWLDALYPMLGNALKQRFAGWRAYYFTADLRLAKLIRLSASKRTVLFNGALECRLFEYRMVAGTNRKPT
ncbi:THUMP domain-containing class I SAM-dependent RNA methyltransferase [Chitinimonas sp. BJB300]|uniref:THUMP domain-containing class I SAM-dependent RNA methyltransferase n=1 Tax=Chitinimonas sp. BJB300 TaxID=1559339 RepID=UPI000C0C6815|nr:THUMP domain-containing protein [Chitinimonas sp. BJB300]PHV10550.1 RNA methyltransferase [Chitinimonas sp. BJB300]TSJ91415.1 class I SAM-dependent RNA methyltransferase [Chitinimonas sp. BJB300]